MWRYKGEKAISRQVKRDDMKNKGCHITQILFLGKGEFLLIAVFLVEDLFSKVKLGSCWGGRALSLHQLEFDYF